MAEALDHAHERGVLHRDIKPSNVLVTSDAMPMLLDFNLAREPLTSLEVEESRSQDGGSHGTRTEPVTVGGTLDYMAPEHLEALADGDGSAERVDGRADIYSLGVVLFEALAGVRPFGRPRTASSAAEFLSRAAADRRREVPSLDDRAATVSAFPREIPAALHAVVRRCLEADPLDRYPTAGMLAADLQAVADDQPLRFAREPILSRASGWLRRRRRPLAVAAAIAAALTVAAVALHQADIDFVERQERRREALYQGGRLGRERRVCQGDGPV